jgi:hypothetical protein
MKKMVAVFLSGFIVATSLNVYANATIKKAEFNNVKVSFKGEELKLKEQLISVQKTGEENLTNYMPVREVIEGMGYSVVWNGDKNMIEIANKEEVKDSIVSSSILNQDEWINSETLKKILYERDVISGSINGENGFGIVGINGTYDTPIFKSTIGDPNNIVRIEKDGREFKVNKADLRKLGIEVE